MSIEAARNVVAKGAELLDSYRFGWHTNINLDRLEMSSAEYCVVGQTFGNYHEGCTIMGLDMEGRRSYGFTDSWNYRSHGYEVTFDELDEAWKTLIKSRLAGQQRPDSLVVETENTVSLTHAQLVELVTLAMDAAPTRGAYSEVGLVATYLNDLA